MWADPGCSHRRRKLIQSPLIVRMSWVKTRLWLRKSVRERSKTCDSCSAETPTLYRCRSNRLKNWKFFCRRCTERLKADRPDSYQYGGTWKRFKS